LPALLAASRAKHSLEVQARNDDDDDLFAVTDKINSSKSMLKVLGELLTLNTVEL